MEASANFLALKNEVAQLILSLQDEMVLEKVRAWLLENPTSQQKLDGIERGLDELKAGKVVRSEVFLKEVAELWAIMSWSLNSKGSVQGNLWIPKGYFWY